MIKWENSLTYILVHPSGYTISKKKLWVKKLNQYHHEITTFLGILEFLLREEMPWPQELL